MPSITPIDRLPPAVAPSGTDRLVVQQGAENGGDTAKLLISALGGYLSVVPYVYAAPTTGSTLTASAGLGAYILDPATEIATLTVVAPPVAADGQVFELATTNTIDALDMSPAAGQTVFGGAAQYLSANGGMSWRFRSANSTWYRRY